jgi:putative endonuclease
MYTVYVLYTEKYDQLYIGYTSDLINRFRSHQFLATKGHTIKYRPWKVIHVEQYETKAEAMKRELALKGGQGRAWIRQYIIPQMISFGFISA